MGKAVCVKIFVRLVLITIVNIGRNQILDNGKLEK